MSSSTTGPKVFIIESLDLQDEQKGSYEGQVISNILNFSEIEHQYHYIRTRKEFEHFVGVFVRSNHRYLHISCHGKRDSITTTFDTIPIEDLSLILETSLDKNRLFMSACSAVSTRLPAKSSA